MTKQTAIICVDDEQTILDSLKIELKNALSSGFLIETAQGGEEAIELVEELLEDDYEVPLIISDYIMPDIKGDELLKRVHLISPTTLKILLTGQADIEAIGNAIKYAKLYRYIAKPWDTEDLILTVSEAIKSYFKDKQLEEKNNELERKIITFHKFVPVQFLKLLKLDDYDRIKLGNCVEKNMTIMFSDIRAFTTLSETMTPQENFNFINAYLSQMEPIINQYHGFIDKYVGDGIMALFPTCADDAVQGAIAMLEQLDKFNVKQQSANPIKIGIGLNTGPSMLGTVGGQNRMDGTVISDAVNLASRIEGLNKTYGTSLLITEQTYQQLTNISQYHIRLIDCVTVKGKTEAVTVYEVFDGDSSSSLKLKSDTLSDFEQGFNFFHNEQFDKALTHFKKVVQINENDKAAEIYLTHCQQILNMTQQSFSILIVDDNAVNARVLSTFLISNCLKVSIVESGENALKSVQLELPHLILLDIMMPGIGGFETCEILKADSKTKNVPVIFMSALTDIADKIKGFELGAVDYITKPFQREEVLARINIHLKLSQLQQKIQAQNTELEINNLALKGKIKNLIIDGEIKNL
ncbi:response regulator [Candidatus Parabeggiatoa sp. HSG14]|uniref:response regulator n=1 Tax=Candidatus Parabeggiatoa sp. HSG14 TaxID=3055593 RepID=UPI0025A7141F|nr:response regulator [Thiotrichales bacterium HSG14]